MTENIEHWIMAQKILGYIIGIALICLLGELYYPKTTEKKKCLKKIK